LDGFGFYFYISLVYWWVWLFNILKPNQPIKPNLKIRLFYDNVITNDNAIIHNIFQTILLFFQFILKFSK